MAREYKEKVTKSLTSSQIINENSTERDVEQLTDTSTTKRNELQTEASSVIDQQNNTDFGANAYVNGSFSNGKIQYGANTSFGTSSSTATSNSNNQAQTYAQEVTESALERVVEKVK